MTELCRVWADLAADPDNPIAVAAARRRLVDLMGHVGTCDVCAAIGESMPFPKRVFAVLGEENLDHLNLSREELAEIRALDVLSADDRNAIPEAVEFLLAGLPAAVGNAARLKPRAPTNVVGAPTGVEDAQAFVEYVPSKVEALQIFDAIDTVNQLARNAAERIPRATIEMSGAGVRMNGASVASRGTVIAEIARQAGVSEAEATSLWAWQLEAAEYCPTLYPSLVIKAAASGILEVALEKSPTKDLVVRWQVRPLRAKPQLADVLEELKEAVAAGARLLLGLQRAHTDGELGQFINEIAAQNATIVKMVGAVTGDQTQPEDYDRAVDPGTSVATLLTRLRLAEQQKQRCLRTIASAAAETIGRGENATRLRAFAEKSQVVVGRNIIALARFV